jgi:prophage regulatory protein
MFNDAPGGANMVTIILRLPAVKARTGLSRSSLYLRIAEGSFPKPISLGGRAVGWVEKEINEWLENQIDISRQVGPVGAGNE